jgi:beta-lactamase class A
MLTPLWLALALGSAGGDALADRLRPLISAHRGEVAVAVKHLRTGETFFHDADKVMPTASLIKLAVMVEVYAQAHEGKLKLTDPVVLRKEDKVPGSGILTEHFSDGLTLPLGDAVRLMIAFSDNTATNLVLDKIGIGSTARRMESLGLPHTKIHSKVFKRETSVLPERSKEYGLGSTTARETVGLLEKLHTGELVSPEASKAMLEHLKKCDDKDKFPRFLPAGTVVAHKTGSVTDARTDAGIIFTRTGPVAVCVLTAKNADTSWQPDNAGNVLCAKVARVVYDYFTQSGS